METVFRYETAISKYRFAEVPTTKKLCIIKISNSNHALSTPSPQPNCQAYVSSMVTIHLIEKLWMRVRFPSEAQSFFKRTSQFRPDLLISLLKKKKKKRKLFYSKEIYTNAKLVSSRITDM